MSKRISLHYLFGILVTAIFFTSCSFLSNDAKTGNVVFSIRSNSSSRGESIQEGETGASDIKETKGYEILLKISGDYTDEQTITLEPGKTATASFEIPVGKKISITVKISKDDMLLYQGEKNDYEVKEGENIITVDLQKCTVDYTGVISVPEFGNFTIEIDPEKTSQEQYRNDLNIVLTLKDKSGKEIIGDIDWTVKLLHQGTDINTFGDIYEFNEALARLSLKSDEEKGFSKYLGVGGVYQIYAAAEYNGEKNSSYFDVFVNNEGLFIVSVDTHNVHYEETGEDHIELNPESITNLLDYIADNGFKNVILKFVGEYDDNTIDYLHDAIYFTKDEIINPERNAPALYYTLDFSEVVGFNEVLNFEFGFENSKNIYLKDVKLPDTLEIIGSNAFLDCVGITKIEIPEGVSIIPETCFMGCSELISVSLPSTISELGYAAFIDCIKLSEITIPEGVEIISDECFKNCNNLFSINLPSTVTTIGDEAFTKCYELQQINIPESVTLIGRKAFSDCEKLTEIRIPEGVTTIDEECFSGCTRLSDIEIPETITEIKKGAFQNCRSLTEFTIPEAIDIIYDDTFQGCNSLTSITIPAAVRSIGFSSFASCKKLASVNFAEEGSLIEIGNAAFMNDYELLEIELPDTVQIIRNQAFYQYQSDKSIKIKLGANSQLKAFCGGAFYVGYFYGKDNEYWSQWRYTTASSNAYYDWEKYADYLKGEYTPTTEQQENGYPNDSTIQNTSESFETEIDEKVNERRLRISGNYCNRYYFKY